MSAQITVGNDVSKDRLDVLLRPTSEAVAVPRDGSGLATLGNRMKVLAPALVVLEATGGHETIVAAALAEAGLPVVVVNPGQVRSFARPLGESAGGLAARTDAGRSRRPSADVCSSSSTSSRGTNAHGKALDGQDSRSRPGPG